MVSQVYETQCDILMNVHSPSKEQMREVAKSMTINIEDS